MNRYLVLTVTLALAGAAVLTGSPARARTQAGHTGAGGGWGTAEEVPGTAALNSAGQAVINSVSCGSAGNCSAGGSYTARRGHVQAFVISRT